MSLTGLAMWDRWQETVQNALPFYARSPLYVDQNVADDEVEQAVAALAARWDTSGMTRDVAHGARVFETSRGPVTRQWVDGNIEIGFLFRALPYLAAHDVLDIGAGYGRLAVMLAPLVRSYVCVDPVSVSVDVCRDYTARYAPSVHVLNVDEFLADLPILRPTLAINVHSWNECDLAQITNWLDVLHVLAVPYLFTVSHDAAYSTWETNAPSFKPLLQARYDLVMEEAIGFGALPHALWRRKGLA
jgi:SAM-dependent methyltransferase